ncbi:MAG: hypothetical protein WBA57_13675 [Elainellaceae cyanobacterium]
MPAPDHCCTKREAGEPTSLYFQIFIEPEALATVGDRAESSQFDELQRDLPLD